MHPYTEFWLSIFILKVPFPPFKTSGSEGFVAAIDIAEEAAVVELVDHVFLLQELLGDHVHVPEVGYPGCLVPVIGQSLDMGYVRSLHLTIVGVGVLQFVQICSIACKGHWHKVDVLHKVIVPACLALVGPGETPVLTWTYVGLMGGLVSTGNFTGWLGCCWGCL